MSSASNSTSKSYCIPWFPEPMGGKFDPRTFYVGINPLSSRRPVRIHGPIDPQFKNESDRRVAKVLRETRSSSGYDYLAEKHDREMSAIEFVFLSSNDGETCYPFDVLKKGGNETTFLRLEMGQALLGYDFMGEGETRKCHHIVMNYLGLDGILETIHAMVYQKLCGHVELHRENMLQLESVKSLISQDKFHDSLLGMPPIATLDFTLAQTGIVKISQLLYLMEEYKVKCVYDTEAWEELIGFIKQVITLAHEKDLGRNDLIQRMKALMNTNDHGLLLDLARILQKENPNNRVFSETVKYLESVEKILNQGNARTSTFAFVQEIQALSKPDRISEMFEILKEMEKEILIKKREEEIDQIAKKLNSPLRSSQEAATEPYEQAVAQTTSIEEHWIRSARLYLRDLRREGTVLYDRIIKSLQACGRPELLHRLEKSCKFFELTRLQEEINQIHGLNDSLLAIEFLKGIEQILKDLWDKKLTAKGLFQAVLNLKIETSEISPASSLPNTEEMNKVADLQYARKVISWIKDLGDSSLQPAPLKECYEELQRLKPFSK